MRRPNPSRQQGFGLFAFVLVTAAVAFTLVVGYASLLTRKAANTLLKDQGTFVTRQIADIEKAWPAQAVRLDAPGSALTEQDLAQYVGYSAKYGSQLVMSDVLTKNDEGLTYRNVLLYIPTQSDVDNPPDVAAFRKTGEFVSCSAAGAYCEQRAYKVFSSLNVERKLAVESQLRLMKVVFKAQAYFKARMLQDPERNVSINYFRAPGGDCPGLDEDLGCLDSYTYVAQMDSVGGYSTHRAATMLGLTDEELFSAWGEPIQASNLLDSRINDVPYTMVFRARKPNNTYITITAVEPI
jgi:hypothetical protein